MRPVMFAGDLATGTTQAQPPIAAYVPEDPELGLVIFPGGGYHGLADHEGRAYAEFLYEQGIASFVVSYRVRDSGSQHPAMLEDALAGLEAARGWLAEAGLSVPLGVMGSSAGGHLAAHALVASEDYDVAAPDFGVLCYPVIAMDHPHGHAGSRIGLLGEDATDAAAAAVNPCYRVGANTAPCFLWHTAEDQAVPALNSLDFARELAKHEVNFELHVYERGRHGLGLNAPFSWAEELLRWLTQFSA